MSYVQFIRLDIDSKKRFDFVRPIFADPVKKAFQSPATRSVALVWPGFGAIREAGKGRKESTLITSKTYLFKIRCIRDIA